jgi:acetoacetyl-CoA reductase
MGRIALVTGGTRGIGESISVMMKENGYTVIANYAGNDQAAQEFTERTGIQTVKFDVADFDSVSKNIADIEATVGPIEILVNNAGIT